MVIRFWIVSGVLAATGFVLWFIQPMVMGAMGLKASAVCFDASPAAALAMIIFSGKERQWTTCVSTAARLRSRRLAMYWFSAWGKAVVLLLNIASIFFGTRVSSLTIAAGEHNESALAFAKDCEKAGAKVYFDRYTFDERYDLCVASPGISQFSRFYENAAEASASVISEVEFAWRESRADSSGSLSRERTARPPRPLLITHILETAGKRVAAVGNIGTTCIESVASDAADVYVAEVSSFQLASMDLFAPQVAVLLNITPDHLYWHMTFDAYAEAKKNIYRHLGDTHGTLVIDAVCDVTRACVKEFKGEDRTRFFLHTLGLRCRPRLQHDRRMRV